jgi:hypothetical protein
MTISDWYQHKAEQCLRLAAEATDAKQRTKFQEEAALWREIGADVLRQEQKTKSP